MRLTRAEATGRGVEIRATLKAMAGVGVQSMTARGAAHGHGIEPCGFDEHVLGRRRNHRVPSAHDAGKAERLRVVGDDQVFGIEHALNAVEGLQLFAFAGAADDDAAFDLVEVESVRGLAHGEPRKVGGIDGIGDFLLLEQREVGGDFRAGEPVARFADGEPRRTRAVKRPQASSASMRTERAGGGLGCWKCDIEGFELDAVDGGRFARDAVVIHGVYAVGGDVHLVERAIAPANRKCLRRRCRAG